MLLVLILCALVYICFRAFTRWSEMQYPRMGTAAPLQLHVLLLHRGRASESSTAAARILDVVQRSCPRVRVEVRCWRKKDVQRCFATEAWSYGLADRASVVLPAIASRYGGIACSSEASQEELERVAAEATAALRRGYVVCLFRTVNAQAMERLPPVTERQRAWTLADDPCVDIVASPAGHTHAIWLVDACARSLSASSLAGTTSPRMLKRQLSRAWAETLCGGRGGRVSYFDRLWGVSRCLALVSPVARVAILLPTASLR